MANEAYVQGMGKINVAPNDYYKSSGNNVGAGAVITAGVLSGLTDIITGFVNAGRIKQTAKFNAAMGDIQIRMAKTVAKYEIARIRQRSDSLFSRQRAIYAKSGVTFDGSPAAVMQNSLKEAELDVFATDLNAEMAGWATEAQGKIGIMETSGAYGAAMMNAGKTILNTGVTLAPYLLKK